MTSLRFKHHTIASLLFALLLTLAVVEGETRELVEQEPVSFSDILAAPDDVELNLKYARQLIKEGRLRNAGATLERILILRPRIGSVRLLYAMVLIRLDSLEQAKAELLLAKKLGLTSDQKKIAAKLLPAVSANNNKLSVRGMLGVGYSRDRNSTAIPQSGGFEIEGNVFEREDIGNTMALTSTASVNMRYKIGGGKKTSLTQDFFLLHKNAFSEHAPDLVALSSRTGIYSKQGLNEFGTSFQTQIVNVNGNRFYSSVGLDASAQHAHSSQWKSRINVSWKDDFFSDFAEGDGLSQKSGNAWFVRFEESYWLTPTHNVSLAYRHLNKNAELQRFAYKGNEIGLSYLGMLNSAGLALSANYARENKTFGLDALIANENRRDVTQSGAISLEGPLAEMLPLHSVLPQAEWHDGLLKFRMKLSIGKMRNRSNIDGYSFNNNEIKLQFTRPFILLEGR